MGQFLGSRRNYITTFILRRLKADRAAPLLADPAVLLLALPVQAAPHRA